ncbi:hypothetical protein E3N88_20398 [Mikania micrantha]|uniref:Uncharacterized protein n=1 Tax=Mikania micrantha TaxID=192012 RepID=A0A5N6NJG9_9ASTR|nr:hypothetical protein E3N88_20398 [Mikania micrantha]
MWLVHGREWLQLLVSPDTPLGFMANYKLYCNQWLADSLALVPRQIYFYQGTKREPRLREKEKQVSRLEEKAHAAAEEEKAGAAGHGQRRNHMSRLGEKTRAAAEEEGAGRGQEQVCRGWGRSFCHDRGRKLESQKRKHRVVIQAAVGEKANSLL